MNYVHRICNLYELDLPAPAASGIKELNNNFTREASMRKSLFFALS